MHEAKNKCISIIVPSYNEEENIPRLFARLEAVLEPYAKRYTFEYIFIDDGSRDRTWEVIATLGQKYQHVQGICFSRNFGHQCALEAGMRSARGDAVVMMDADLENPPETVPQLIDAWEQGYMVVNTQRTYHKDWTRFKRASSICFYHFMNAISDVKLEVGAPDFRLMDRRVIDEINKIKDSDQFYRGLINWLGFKSTTITYKSGIREYGISGYSFAKMFDLAVAGILSFSTLPLRIIVGVGISLIVLTTVLLGIISYVRFAMHSDYFRDIAFLVVVIIGGNGLILVATGVVAMYLLRISQEVGKRPNYVIEDEIMRIQP